MSKGMAEGGVPLGFAGRAYGEDTGRFGTEGAYIKKGKSNPR